MTDGLAILPRAIVSAHALRNAAQAAVAQGGRCADLRADAYGHGVLEVARVVADAGVSAVLVDDDRREALSGVPLEVITRGEADIDPAQLYGLAGADTRPAMRLSGQVMSTKRLRAGDAVSYGYTYRASRDTTVALITGGYAQGIVRALGNHAHVEIHDVLHPIVGRVAMDVCVVDVGETAPDVGAPVVYFGGDGPARGALSEWSRITGLRADELVTSAGLKGARTWTS